MSAGYTLTEEQVFRARKPLTTPGNGIFNLAVTKSLSYKMDVLYIVQSFYNVVDIIVELWQIGSQGLKAEWVDLSAVAWVINYSMYTLYTDPTIIQNIRSRLYAEPILQHSVALFSMLNSD